MGTAVRMGRITGTQAAALLGVAPYPDDSGQPHGKESIRNRGALAKLADGGR